MGCCFDSPAETKKDKDNDIAGEQKEAPLTLERINVKIGEFPNLNENGVSTVKTGQNSNPFVMRNYNSSDIKNQGFNSKLTPKLSRSDKEDSVAHQKIDPFSESNTDIANPKCFGKSNTILSQTRLQRTSTIQRPSYIIQEQNITSFLSDQDCGDIPMNIVILGEKIKSEQLSSKLNLAYYSVINKKMYAKKNYKTALKVRSPSMSKNLYCQSEKTKEGIFITEGIPIENIRLLKNSSAYIFENNYQIQITLQLKCLHCERIKKYSYSVCLIQLNTICECQESDFELLDIKSNNNIPLWMNNMRINTNKLNVVYEKGGFIRALGCVECWRLENCIELDCGCWICIDCQTYQSDCKLHNHGL